MDWASIVEGMASLKAKASFELLVSIYNPNYLSATVDYGSGTLTHDNVQVGILDFGTDIFIKGNSITDVLVTVTFSPEKWEALSLTSEYYLGTLTFMVDASATVTIPAIGYTANSQWTNYLVHVGGDYADRTLCACEKWA